MSLFFSQRQPLLSPKIHFLFINLQIKLVIKNGRAGWVGVRHVCMHARRYARKYATSLPFFCVVFAGTDFGAVYVWCVSYAEFIVALHDKGRTRALQDNGKRLHSLVSE